MALRDHPRGPWEQQDGYEVVNDRIWVDFGMILGLVYGSFRVSKWIKKSVMFTLVPEHFLFISDSMCRRLGLPKSLFPYGMFCKKQLVTEIRIPMILNLFLNCPRGFINLGTLEGGLKFHGFARLPRKSLS